MSLNTRWANKMNEPVAIIGSACRFAGGVDSPSKLWDLLQNPRDVRSEIPSTRFSAKGFYHPNHAQHGHSNVMHSYFIEDDVSTFDAEFFGIKPIEAAAMDPQQRLLLETVYESIESAGLAMEGLRNSDTGVFVGAMCADYEAMQLRNLDAIPTYFATGTARSVLSNRISHFFDWHGPCMTIDTACSSSLVAIDQAVKALRLGESSMAIAGGSNLILGPENYIMESKLKMLSPDGRGRMWDKAADGYARGDGVAAVVLKMLSAAIADGDHIECVLRETGVNQDGATPGITMPSAAAQRALIESTYARAGLDLRLRTDRPQFFEAHGTGTPAGDPIEAEAVSKTFFGQCKDEDRTRLYAGSIKTVLGHTEGAAGIAAVLKASLAIQHGRIPPNLLFENVSPSVAPFYENLQIPTDIQPWPEVCQDSPRRASVNSFGFGGTNAHAILESYDIEAAAAASNDSVAITCRDSTSLQLFTPFLFSAMSPRSLRANLLAFVTHLQDHASAYDSRNVAYTLRQRRSVFPYRAAFASKSLEELRKDILESIEKNEDQSESIINKVRARETMHKGVPKTRIMGVFTGQGAQYPRMGADLVENSPFARQVIEDLEKHLSQLPDADRPVWSLKSELLKGAPSSRIYEAAVSQPLCTAVQILLVDLLRLAQVNFDVVIGHSSGEIAAAYAAGYLTARDAIVIAYYRGLHCRRAGSPNGNNIKGAMLAVDTSLEDATQLCEDELFLGRICVAACNSPSSVTISGDEDAIAELEAVLDDENKFNRRLRVDQAYHSSHMLPCFESYVDSLCRAGVKAGTSCSPGFRADCRWYSSVSDDSERLMDPCSGPRAEYWAENMTRPVLFSQALTAVLSDHEEFDVVLEVGAHPSLKGPCSQTIRHVLGQNNNLAYQGCLDRKVDAVQAMSTCLGFLWSRLETSSIDLNAYETASSQTKQADVAFASPSPYTLVKGLPSYQWDHKAQHWHESRRSRRMRLREQPFHPLLGDECPDSAPHCLRWRNVLSPSEMSWLESHQVQGQIVFPAAGYVCTALEAARMLAVGREREIRIIELSDFLIHQAITFDGENSAVEVLVELSNVTKDDLSCVLRAKFTYSAALGAQTSSLTLVASAELRVLSGPASSAILPVRRGLATPHLIDVEPQRQYRFMDSLGYNFTGAFRSLKRLRRKLGESSCDLHVHSKGQSEADNDDDSSMLMIQPAQLDGVFQSIMLAFSYPGDEQLRTLHLPARISKIRLNPALFLSSCKNKQQLSVDSTANRIDQGTSAPARGFSGNANLYVIGCNHAAVQVDGVKFVPLTGAVSNADRDVFCGMDLVLASPDGVSAAVDIAVTQEDVDLLWVLSRIACFYLRKFDDEIPMGCPARRDPTLDHYLRYARHMTDLLRSGEHRFAKMEWLTDTFDQVMADINKHGFRDRPDVKLMLLVGETMPRVFNQETTMIEQMRSSGILDQFYAHGFGPKHTSLWLSQTVKQLTDRHPHLDVLEVGAGTGGATKNILRAVDGDFGSYTFTDISSSFFEKAADTVEALGANWSDRVLFKVYDVERDVVEQGFEEAKYDVVVASFVLHATAKLADTTRKLRRLLKPGGYLVVGEATSDGPLQSGDSFIFGALSGWWLGVDEGRTLSPFITVQQWDDLLKRTGFSGIDTLAPPAFLETFGLVLFVSQAVDDRITFLRHPLEQYATPTSAMSPLVRTMKIATLCVIGGATEPVARLAHEIVAMFKHLATCTRIVQCKTFEDVDHLVLDETSAVISLAELDAPVFKEMTYKRWLGFRNVFATGKTLLCITSGRLSESPWSNMPVGFGRTAVNETPDLHVQFVDFAAAEVGEIDARTITDCLLRLHASASGKHFSHDHLLWTDEPEVVIDEAGRHFVPRLKPLSIVNNRYNSAQHPIFRHVDVSTSSVELHQTSDRCSLAELTRYDTAAAYGDTAQGMIKLRTLFTLLHAIKTEAGHRFLVLGVDSNGLRHLALVPRALSTLNIPNNYAVQVPLEDCDLAEADFLTAVAAFLVSLVVVDPLFPGQTLILHNASPLIARAVEARASFKGINLQFTLSCMADLDSGDNSSELDTAKSSNSWTRLPAYLSRSELSLALPANAACFVGLSPQDQSETEEAILSILPRHCRRETASSIYSLDGLLFDAGLGSTSNVVLINALKEAVEFARTTHSPNLSHGSGVEIVSLVNLINRDMHSLSSTKPAAACAIIDWTAAPTLLPVQASRLDVKPLFKGDKTYWLCGMSGALGISLCDWMIDRGVKYLVITSRDPKVEQSWIANHKKNSVAVEIISCDVTDEKALRAVHERVLQTMPQIAGVLNGAMVLRDSSIPNMQYDHVMDVVQPKVLGSLHLDRIFHNANLDFFVLVSSITCVIGNVGQANYAAANMYMCSLAANRRKRGLNAAAVNVGAIIGAGYITRETDRALDITVERMNMMHLSEEDFHQIIAEAIEAGHIDSPNGPELTTGLLNISPEAPNVPKWYSNPKFCRFIARKGTSHEEQRGQTTIASIQDQLQTCETRQDLRLVVQKSFAKQLSKMLQYETSVSASVSIPNEDIIAKRGPELGLDSLVSVDIRSWFSKNFQVSIPVLKIMGNDTMANLVESVVAAIPAELTPRRKELNGSTDSSSSASTSEPGTLRTDQTSSPSLKTIKLIDWDAETTPPADMSNVQISRDFTGTYSSPPATPPNVIVLTGATGLLGHHLLDHLLSKTSVRTIHCLAVRQLASRLKNRDFAHARNPRVRYYEGDLSDPLLGLSEEEAAFIFSETDAVIHNGADTSHIKSYAALRASNVGSTLALSRLCLERKIPFHYISSAGVAIYQKGDLFHAVSATTGPGSLLPPADGSFGYGCSKWANERFLERMHDLHGLPVAIYRPSTVVREGQDATDERAKFDWVNVLLHYVRKLGAAPELSHQQGGFLDLVKVESCCTEMVHHVLQGLLKSGKEEGNMLYVNLVGDVVIPMIAMRDLDADKGKRFDLLPLGEWIAKAVLAGMHPAVALLIQEMDEPNGLKYPRLLRGKDVQ